MAGLDSVCCEQQSSVANCPLGRCRSGPGDLRRADFERAAQLQRANLSGGPAWMGPGSAAVILKCHQPAGASCVAPICAAAALPGQATCSTTPTSAVALLDPEALSSSHWQGAQGRHFPPAELRDLAQPGVDRRPAGAGFPRRQQCSARSGANPKRRSAGWARGIQSAGARQHGWQAADDFTVAAALYDQQAQPKPARSCKAGGASAGDNPSRCRGGNRLGPPVAGRHGGTPAIPGPPGDQGFRAAAVLIKLEPLTSTPF